LVARLLQVIVRFVLGRRRAEATRRTDRRKLHRDASGFAQRRLLPRPAVEIHDRDLAAEDAAVGCDADGRDAVRSRDGDALAFDVERDARAKLWVERRLLGGVLKSTRARLVEPERRGRFAPA